MNQIILCISGCTCLCDILYCLYEFITNPIVGYVIGSVIGFIIAIKLIYWQFSKSIANERLRKVEDATRKIIKEKKEQEKGEEDNRTIAMLRNNYRYSLGVVIDRITSVYHAVGKNKRTGKYPNFIDCEGDRWGFFLLYIKPVIADINQFAFLGWLPCKNMEKLKLLVKFCYQLQSIVEIHDAIMDDNIKSCIIFEEKGKEYFEINRQDTTHKNEWIMRLEEEYKELEKLWNEWLKLVDMKKQNK